MAIKSVEIICRPCHRCDRMKEIIKNVIKALEYQHHASIKLEIKHTVSLVGIERYGLGPAQTPVLLINGYVEFAGRKVDARLIRLKLDAINKGF